MAGALKGESWLMCSRSACSWEGSDVPTVWWQLNIWNPCHGECKRELKRPKWNHHWAFPRQEEMNGRLNLGGYSPVGAERAWGNRSESVGVLGDCRCLQGEWLGGLFPRWLCVLVSLGEQDLKYQRQGNARTTPALRMKIVATIRCALGLYWKFSTCLMQPPFGRATAKPSFS